MATNQVSWEFGMAGALENAESSFGEIRVAVSESWPYYCLPGETTWDTTDEGDWCGGHWVECLLFVSGLDGEPRTERLRPYPE